MLTIIPFRFLVLLLFALWLYYAFDLGGLVVGVLMATLLLAGAGNCWRT